MLIAGATGVDLQFPCYQNGQLVSLQGATVTLTVIDPKNVRTSLTCSVGSTVLTLPDGSTVAANYWVHHVTASTDFTVAGTYQAQIVASLGGGNVFYSDPFNIYVGRQL